MVSSLLDFVVNGRWHGSGGGGGGGCGGVGAGYLNPPTNLPFV